MDPATRLRLFAFTAAEQADRYVDLLRAFDEARASHALSLTPEELRLYLSGPIELIALRDALDQLVTWGLLHRSQDGSRVRSLAEYRQRRSRYQMSDAGYLAWTAVRQVLDAPFAPAELRALTFPKLVTALRELARAVALGEATSTNQQLHLLDRELHELAERAARFEVGVRNALRVAEAEPEVFVLLKDQLVAHLDGFASALSTHRPALAAGVLSVQEAGVATLIELATQAEEATALRDTATRRAAWALAWRGVEDWFGPGEQSRASALDRATTDDIRNLLLLLRRVVEARRSGISRATQLEDLAARLAAASDIEARALWQATVQMRPQASFRSYRDDPAAIPAGTPWAEAPAEPVPEAIRRQGKEAPPPSQVRCLPAQELQVRAFRQRLRQEQAAAKALTAEILTAQAQNTPLPATAMPLLLRLLGRALASRPERVATEGGLRLRLRATKDAQPLAIGDGVLTVSGAQIVIEATR
jgi:uncharacterized protein (TIGR02677 family)